MKVELPDWIDINTQEPYVSLEDFGENVIGFVYLIEFTDGKKYIGKKELYCERWMPRRTLGRPKDSIKIKVVMNKKGERYLSDLRRKESNWKRYKGSSAESAVRTPKVRYVIAKARDGRELTYLEAKMLFKYDTLENEDFLNKNILGKFYRKNMMPT